MAFMGDAISHAALLGVSLGILMQFQNDAVVLLVCVIMAFVISYLQNKYTHADSVLSILAHGSLALGLVLMAINTADQRVDLRAVLMGDILSVNASDLIFTAALCVLLVSALLLFWKRMLMNTIDESLAQVEGYSPFFTRFLLLSIVGLTVGFGIKIVGTLMMSGLLIIPAVAARRISSSPEAMAIYATVIGLVSCLTGLYLSFQIDLPLGPLIICSALLCYILLSIVGKKAA